MVLDCFILTFAECSSVLWYPLMIVLVGVLVCRSLVALRAAVMGSLLVLLHCQCVVNQHVIMVLDDLLPAVSLCCRTLECMHSLNLIYEIGRFHADLEKYLLYLFL